MRQLLIAIVGPNIAGASIDGALYLVGQLFDRGRVQRVGVAVREAPDERAAIALVAGELNEMLESVTKRYEREALYKRIAANVRGRPVAPNPVTKADLKGAFASFWLVVLSSAPAAIPFLLIDEAHFALRVSNAILLAFLFVTGYWWARYTLGNPWRAGFLFLVGGLALVWVAIQLGG